MLDSANRSKAIGRFVLGEDMTMAIVTVPSIIVRLERDTRVRLGNLV